MFKIDSNLLNVLLLSLSFTIIYSAYFSALYLNKRRLKDFDLEKFFGYSLSVLYTFFCLSNLFSPLLIRRFGSEIPLFIFSLSFFVFQLAHVFPSKVFLIIAAAFAGTGSSVIWNCQGTILTLNSNKETLSRNNSIFRGIYQLSYLLGSIFLTVMLRRATDNTGPDNILSVVYICLTVISFVGSLSVLIIVFRARKKSAIALNNRTEAFKSISLRDTLVRPLQVFRSRKFYLMIPIFIWVGASLSMTASIIPNCINTPIIDLVTGQPVHPKGATGIYGICFSIANILGNTVFILLAKKMTKIPNAITIILAFITTIIIYVILILTWVLGDKGELAASSTLGTKHLLMLCLEATFLGLIDTILSTRPATVLGARFPKSLPEAFSGLKLFQAATQAIMYGLAQEVSLRNRFIILMVIATLGTISFVTSLLIEDNSPEELYQNKVIPTDEPDVL